MSQPGRFYGIKDRGVYGTVSRHFNVVVDHHGAYLATLGRTGEYSRGIVTCIPRDVFLENGD
jgi:hypothetical protein